MLRTVIKGSGSYIPELIRLNKDFEDHLFYAENNQLLEDPASLIIKKFTQITGINERRYVTGDQSASDIGSIAAQRAIEDSRINPEEIDQLILAHNFGDVLKGTIQSDAVPSLASRVKHQLGIQNPACIAYDVLFGCPGWIQGLIQADAFFKAGIAKNALVIGAETLSRVIDVYDRDSMIFSDGAGAVVLSCEASSENGPGILSASSQSYTTVEEGYINMGSSFCPGTDEHTRFIKMKGRKVYEFAIKHVPSAMKECLDKSGASIHELKKIFIHQANEKMDEAIIHKMYQLYNIQEPPPGIMPMSIGWLGNSSVATIPTLYDLVKKDKVDEHHLLPGDVILFASVGAGMNINAVCYRC